jgi:hypothetical protein
MAAECAVIGVGVVVGKGGDGAEPFRVEEGEGRWAFVAELWGQFGPNRCSRLVASVNQIIQIFLMTWLSRNLENVGRLFLFI